MHKDDVNMNCCMRSALREKQICKNTLIVILFNWWAYEYAQRYYNATESQKYFRSSYFIYWFRAAISPLLHVSKYSDSFLRLAFLRAATMIRIWCHTRHNKFIEEILDFQRPWSKMKAHFTSMRSPYHGIIDKINVDTNFEFTTHW